MFQSNKNGWVGIDVGTSTIKIAQLGRQGSQARLLASAIVRREQPWQGPLGPDESRQEIDAARDLAQSLRGRQAACLPPMSLCRVFDTSDSDHVAIDEAAASRLSTDAFTWGSWPSGEEGREQVTVAAIEDRWSNKIAGDVQQAGFQCQAMDVLPLSLGRLCKEVHQQQLPVGIIDWGYTSVTFLCVDADTQFTRVIPRCGFGEAIRYVAESYDLSPRAAEDTILRVGLPDARDHRDPREGQANGLERRLLPLLKRMVREISRTMSFVGSHFPSLIPERLWLCGGGATIANIDTWLRHQCSLDIECWQPPPPLVGQLTRRQWALLGPSLGLSAAAWAA